ncbi:hypothetical protein [Desulfovibrio aminophilus]|uniref:sulfotransferase-like domain-containing protein n=1 Tax=Desulfovibrio aminophilus TaxID=81425 RepID=UPI003395F3FE
MNKLIYNWMYPRSLTTVFMRILTNRGDMNTIFEPTLPLYWRERNEPGVQSHQDYNGWPVVYEDIIKKIYKIAEEKTTFVKECTYHALDKYMADEKFLRRVIHTFQIRDPKYVILSFWKVIGSQRSLRIEDIGPVASCVMFDHLTKLKLHALDGGERPLVIDGEDFQNDPEGIMAAWCEALEIEYKPEAMQWQPEWRSEYNHCKGFYGDVSSSTGIQKNMEAFMYDERVVEALFEDLPKLKLLYDYCLPYHEKLYAHRLKPKKL